MIYGLYLQSDGVSPDFEAQVEAESHNEALRKFRKQYKDRLKDFTDDNLLNEIGLVIELKPKI